MPPSISNSLTRRNLCATVAVCVCCLVTANAAIAYLTRNTLPRQSMAMIRNSPGAQAVILGNSLLVVGFDQAEFDSQLGFKSTGADTLNLAMTTTGPLEHLLFLRYAFAHGTAPRLLVYGFVDMQLSEPVALSNRDLIGKREVVYYLEPEYARRFCNFSLRDTLQFEVMRRVSMLAERSAVWGKVELFRRKLAAQGMPLVEENRLGRVADFNLLEAPDPQSFAAAVAAAADSPFNAPFEEIVRESGKAGARVVVVEMPMTSEHRRRFYDTLPWVAYRSHARQLLASQGVLYIDASDWVAGDSLFMDHIHLNSRGATLFSRKLGQTLRHQFPDLFPAALPAAKAAP